MIYLTGGGLTARTLPVLHAHPDIGLLAQPNSYDASVVRRFRVWGADNGCFAQGAAFDADRWLAWLRRLAPYAPACRFATAPDVVADARATWARSEPFLTQLRALGYPAALVAQDGLEGMDVSWGAFDALFIGGSTRWKLSSAAREIAREAKARGLWVHMGRVNSLRRLEIAEGFGCDSADGNFLGFGPDQNLPKLLRWLRQIEIAPMLNFVPRDNAGRCGV